MVTSVNELSTQANTKIVKSKPMIYHSLLITEMSRHVQVDICNVIEAKNLSVNNHLLRIAAYVYLQAYLYLQMYVCKLCNTSHTNASFHYITQALLKCQASFMAAC